MIELLDSDNGGSEIFYEFVNFPDDFLSATEFHFGTPPTDPLSWNIAFSLCGVETAAIPSMGQWALFILLLSMMALGVGYMFAGARNKGTVS